MNEEHRKKQRFLTIFGISLVGIVFLVGAWFVLSEHFENRQKSNKKYISTAELPLDGVDPKEIWVDQIRTENEVVQGKMDYIQEMFVGRLKEEVPVIKQHRMKLKY